MAYPEWVYYPSRSRPPEWVASVVAAFETLQNSIDTTTVRGLTSDDVLAKLRSGLEALGFEIEAGKGRAAKVRRPVLFGDRGAERVAYEIDGWNDEHRIVLEVEAGRGALGNAVYRDLVRTPLIVDARFLVLAVMSEYHYKAGGKAMIYRSYREAHNILDAIYASGRLKLPFEGVLLLGY